LSYHHHIKIPRKKRIPDISFGKSGRDLEILSSAQGE
jgi:hypothetical protein